MDSHLPPWQWEAGNRLRGNSVSPNGIAAAHRGAGANKGRMWNDQDGEGLAPQANPVMQQQVAAGADKDEVEVTSATEAPAKAGHDMYTFLNWDGVGVCRAAAGYCP